ncbi:MAG: hypothetical protein KatS3mg089_0593 [Patescibacteria group bacterium]|nr:MAG: hypothetical protein KatS3mg089_0593 [Patescibacteria group bacterium]
MVTIQLLERSLGVLYNKKCRPWQDKNPTMSNNSSARKELITNFVPQLLSFFGEDISREGLVETLQRVYRMYEELLSDYLQDPKVVFQNIQSNGYKDLITLTNIRFYSLCEHHMIPFLGKFILVMFPTGGYLGFLNLLD